jgi:hypothetical protein
MSLLSADDGSGMVAIALGVFGIGAGLAQPAATAALMGSVPREHAGVGSALNDTVQQAGAALGIAILGSALASNFTATMPESAPAAARRSIGEALAVAASTGDNGLAHVAKTSFAHAMSGTFVASASAVAVLGSAVLAFVLVRDKLSAVSPEATAEAAVVVS